MEKVQELSETGLGGHWVNDNELTRNNEKSVSLRLDRFVRSMEEEIDVLKKQNHSPVERLISTESRDKKVDFEHFELINYNSKFNIISGRKYSTATQKWIGYIEDLQGDKFFAKLVDKTNGGTNEYGEFSLDEVSPDDLDLLKVNAIFYWSIGFEMINGQRKAESILRFKRSAKLDAKHYNEGFDFGAELGEGLNWE